MPIRIPEKVFPGFITLSQLSPEQVHSISDFLKNMPVGIKPSEIDSFLAKELQLSQSRNIVELLISFGELLDPANVDYKELSQDLFEAFKTGINGNDKYTVSDSQFQRLQEALLEIFTNSQKLKLTLKALKLTNEDECLFIDSRIISDIRIVFNDDINERKRNAVIIHKLHITYNNNNEKKGFFISLQLAELKELKDNIERAIKKDDLIREDYKTDISFIQTN